MSTMTIIFPHELLLGTCTCFRELLFDFYLSSGKRKPEQIIIFRFVTHLKVILNCAILAVEVHLPSSNGNEDSVMLFRDFICGRNLLSFYFRDGVSEGQFNQVLNIELAQIIEVETCPPVICSSATSTSSVC